MTDVTTITKTPVTDICAQCARAASFGGWFARDGARAEQWVDRLKEVEVENGSLSITEASETAKSYKCILCDQSVDGRPWHGEVSPR